MTAMRALRIAAHLALAALPAAALAGQKITLKMADYMPSGHAIHELVTKPFAEAIAQATNGEVQIQLFPAEQLGKAKEMLPVVQSGKADIALVVPAFFADKMPLSGVVDLPGITPDICKKTAALRRMTSENGLLFKEDFAPNGVRPLVSFMHPPLQILTKNKAVSLKSLEGLKIQTQGDVTELVLLGLKAVPTQLPPTLIFDGLMDGRIDAATVQWLNVQFWDLAPLFKSGTDLPQLNTIVLTYAISESRWKQLPEDVRKAMAEAGEAVSKSACARDQEIEMVARARARGQGVAPINFSREDLEALDGIFSKVQSEWVQSMEKRGRPGRQAMSDFRAAVKATP
jgi:TRAP-type C4-dicarboxylate transport system substrate-binding protein